MTATNLNHVSVSARDVEESARFYGELFGMERIPTPNFGFPVVWLRVGDLQVHLFQRDVEAPVYHHLALTVDDLDPIYRRARELGVLDSRTNGHHLRELPDGAVQLYLRDPSGNLVEVDHPDASQLAPDVRADLQRLADVHPQDEVNRRATLFLALREGQPTTA
ncbi:MAG TPA: VOC family protein [Candidatus Dormibacteraeota bacterium]|nr:VOC family protein [Candidatus Dormibacteraeota bacterium]